MVELPGPVNLAGHLVADPAHGGLEGEGQRFVGDLEVEREAMLTALQYLSVCTGVILVFTREIEKRSILQTIGNNYFKGKKVVVHRTGTIKKGRLVNVTRCRVAGSTAKGNSNINLLP